MTLIKDLPKCLPQLLWLMANVINESAIVFNLVSVDECVAMSNLGSLVLLT